MIYPYLGPWWDHLGGVSRDGSPLIGPLEKLWKIHWINTQLPESPEAIRRRARQPWRPRVGNMWRSRKAGLHWEAKPQLHVQSPMHAKCNSLSEFSESIDWHVSYHLSEGTQTWHEMLQPVVNALHFIGSTDLCIPRTLSPTFAIGKSAVKAAAFTERLICLDATCA
jgi:hypothetical protein